MSDSGSAAITVSAPVRLDFAGAWTDVAPFATENRGVVVNAAIDLRTRVRLRSGQDRYRLRADDLNQEIDVATAAELAVDGRLQLLKAAVRRYQLGPCELHSAAEAPPGSGLGTSGALSVVLTQACMIATGRSPSALDVAYHAWQLETIDAAVPGGQQDQYAAALGGFQKLEFDHGVTTASPIVIDPAFATHLAEHTVICYTGRSRFSGETISRVMHGYQAGDQQVVRALGALVAIGEAMTDALAAADLARVGALLQENWLQQQRLAPGMRTAEMARLEAAMLSTGAIGGKAAGAGAGGSMFFVVPGDVAAATAVARQQGATVVPTRWADRGVSID